MHPGFLVNRSQVPCPINPKEQDSGASSPKFSLWECKLYDRALLRPYPYPSCFRGLVSCSGTTTPDQSETT